jgi:hypothetical protein
LTFTAVVRPKNLAVVSRHTRELECHDGRLQESKPHHEGVHVQCPVVPKNKTDAVFWEGEGHDHVPSVLQAALSGPKSKAPGSAGGYLLRAGSLARSQPSVRGPSSATSARRVLAALLPEPDLLFQLPHPRRRRFVEVNSASCLALLGAITRGGAYCVSFRVARSPFRPECPAAALVNRTPG